MTAAAATELRSGLADLARRSAGVAKACNNVESVKLYLVLPMLRVLGYDVADPLEVYPNHETDPISGPSGPSVVTADFAILRNGQPVIAVGAGRSREDVTRRRTDLAAYYGAWPSTRLAVVSNGLQFEFFVDSHEPGRMDVEPFLTLDLPTMADQGPSDDVVETLLHATKAEFDPDRIAERAHLGLVKKRLRTAFAEEAKKPSEELARAMLARIGFPGVRKEAIERYYAGVVKSAFEEALVLPVVQRLKASGVQDGVASGIKLDVSQSLAAADHEITLVNTLRRRLAYLAKDEAEYQAVDRIGCTSYVGRLVVFLDRDPDGRLVEIIRGSGTTDRYVFSDGEHVTASIQDLDAPLHAAFTKALSATAAEATQALRKAG